jgi:hypothetical protein
MTTGWSEKTNVFCFIFLLLFSMGEVSASTSPDPLIMGDLEEVFSSPTRVQGYPYQDLVEEACERHDLAVPFVLAVARGESFFNPNAVSSKGAIGLMQVMPTTAADYGVEKYELFDPKTNIDVGVQYLADLFAKLQDPYLTLAAYYCGPGGVDREGFTLRKDCDEYVHYVHEHMTRILSQSEAVSTPGTREVEPFVLTRFDNFLDAERFLAFMAVRLPDIPLDVFRGEISRSDHVRYQYRIVAATGPGIRKADICTSVEKACGFSFCK